MSHQHTNAIEVSGLNFSYGGEPVLANVDLVVPQKTLCALVGPNGGGKSTLSRCIAGIQTPQSGSVTITCSHNAKNPSHKISYVGQRATSAIDFPISVREVVSTGLTTGYRKWFSRHKQEKEKVDHALESVGLESLANTNVNNLSVGQKQRVFMAKAFASDPDVLILDEPTAGVDADSQQLFRSAITHIIEDHGATVLLVSHELSAVADVINQIVVLKNEVIFDGPPDGLEKYGITLSMSSDNISLLLDQKKASIKGE